MKKLLAIVLTAAMLLAMLCACAAKPTETAATDTKATIGILMPTKEQTIWSIQGERLTEAFQKAGYATQIEYAEDDSAKQAMQIENMITKGVNVLVIAAVDCAALTDACEKAKDAGIYVIADDRLITNTKAVDFYVTFDLVRMGELQGTVHRRQAGSGKPGRPLHAGDLLRLAGRHQRHLLLSGRNEQAPAVSG